MGDGGGTDLVDRCDQVPMARARRSRSCDAGAPQPYGRRRPATTSAGRADGSDRLAEVDGNRTRRTGITHPTRFEGGGAHQALGHLHGPTIGAAPSDADPVDRDGPRSPRDEALGPKSRRDSAESSGATPGDRLAAMKKLILLIVVLALAAIAAKKMQETA